MSREDIAEEFKNLIFSFFASKTESPHFKGNSTVSFNSQQLA